MSRLHSATTGGTGAGAADRKRKTSEKQQAMEVKARVQEEGQEKAVARSLLKTEGGPDNFFNFPPDSADIWSPNFTKSLRKTSQVFETVPFIPDSSVEKIGGAFVEEERSLRQVLKRSSVDRTDSDSPQLHSYRSYSRYTGDQIRDLEKQIEDLKVARWQPPSIAETIDRLLLGKSCSLSWFKSIKEKKELLDRAVKTKDGNCILAVVLFIRKTVDHSLLLNMLDKDKVAAQHYANFLKQIKNWKELKTLYRRLNDYDSLGYFTLQECNVPGLEKEERIRLIKSLPVHFKNLQLKHGEDIQHVEEYNRLIHKQQKIEEAAGHGADVVLREQSVLFTSLTTTLLYCCRNHRGQERNTGNPEDLRKMFNISERQYFQMDLLALALNRDWKGIGSMLTSKGLLGFKRKKSPIGFERVVRLLGQERYRAPDFVLVQYLEEIDDVEVRYQLAMEVSMYDTALECLKLLKDRERLKALINHIPINKHREFRPKIDAVLANSQIKWK